MSFALAFLGRHWLAVGLGVICVWLFLANSGLKNQLADERQAFFDYKLAQVEVLNEAVSVAVAAAESAKDLEREAAVEEALAQVEVEVVTNTIIREVEVHVTPEIDLSYPLPNGWVHAHDASASGATIASIANRAGQPSNAASSVTMSRSAELLATNYGACRANAIQLAALIKWERDVQAWWEEIRAAWPTGN